MKINIPQDVISYVRKHFARCNRNVSYDLAVHPAVHEETLDANLIGYWSRRKAPVKLKSGWIVRVDAHFIGGGRHFGTWEVADIGIMIVYRKNRKVVKSKLAFVQSKKLYANSLIIKKDNPNIRRFGLGRLIDTEEEHNEIIQSRILHFTEASKYQALIKDDDQQRAMKSFQNKYGMKMYYLLYNPLKIPHQIKMPLTSEPKLGNNSVGVRILPKDVLDKTLETFESGHRPSYGDIKYMVEGEFAMVRHQVGWRLEYFIADLMIQCKEGVIDDSPSFERMVGFMNSKRYPMSSALSVTFEIE